MLSGVREEREDVTEFAESIELRCELGYSGESDDLRGALESWVARRCRSIQPSSPVRGTIPFKDAGAGVPAALASFSILACCISSVMC